MTAIDRTAYPRPGSRLTREELRARYTLTETDLTFVRLECPRRHRPSDACDTAESSPGPGLFPALDEIHADTMAHLARSWD